MSDSILDSLNPEQREAVACTNGPLLVLAGAGTGKTRVITCRIAYMIKQGIDPASILGVTFTNKAAKEMRDRLCRIVPPDASEKVTLGTFHSFCGRVLRRDIHYAGNFNASFSIADTADQTSLARQAAAELGFAKEEVPTNDAVAFISSSKNKMLDPEQALFKAEAEAPANVPLARIYERYQKLLELQNTVDFDDMLLLTLRIFENNPDVLKYYQKKYKYILVDEYQDTNAAQFKIISLLAGEDKNVCVVGDDDQSIYAWRGADVSNILDFPKYFPGAVEIKLEQNYRSTNKILSAANAVICKNSSRYTKSLWSSRGDGENIRVIRLLDGDAEARFVADAINDVIDRNPDLTYSDCAILYRSNHLSRVFEQEFRRRGIRPKIIGGQEFFQRKEVKDAAAYLKLAVNERDDQSLLRIIALPPRGIGDKAIETLRDLRKAVNVPLCRLLTDGEAQKRLSAVARSSAKNLGEIIAKAKESFSEPGNLAEKAKNYLEDTGYLTGLQRIYKDLKEAENRQENVQEFINYIAQYEQSLPRGQEVTLRDFMESYSLMDDNDRTEDDDDRDAPIMSTVHAAKGLEFPCVFIVGMEHGLFPHERSMMEGSEDEERRLFYVAITRAKEYLFITYAGERFKYGERVRQRQSEFLKDIPDDIADIPDDPDDYFPKMDDEERMEAFREILAKLKKSDF